jgi:signal transduction histidine kinase
MVLFATLMIITVFGIFFLHRIAGPVYRFRSILRRIAVGEIPDEFRLREGDFFTETADDLNAVLRALRLNRQRVESLQKKLEEAIQKYSSSPVASDLAEFKNGLSKLR